MQSHTESEDKSNEQLDRPKKLLGRWLHEGSNSEVGEEVRATLNEAARVLILYTLDRSDFELKLTWKHENSLVLSGVGHEGEDALSGTLVCVEWEFDRPASTRVWLRGDIVRVGVLGNNASAECFSSDLFLWLEGGRCPHRDFAHLYPAQSTRKPEARTRSRSALKQPKRFGQSSKQGKKSSRK